MERLESLVRQVLSEATDRELKLAVAESCTGGQIAAALTDVPGCSHAFERGFITYSDEAKTELLGVPAEMIEEHGVVSAPVALAMADGALEKSRADVAVSVTGYADNTTDEAKPGLVFVGAARRGRETVVRRFEFGDLGRDEVRRKASCAALELFCVQIV